MVKKKKKISTRIKSVDLQEEIISKNFPKGRSKLAILVLILVAITFLIYFFKGLFIAAVVENQPIFRLAVVKELEKQGGKQVLDSLVVKALLRSEAAKKKINVSVSEVDDQIKKLEAELSKQGQKLDELLTAQGMTRNDLKEQTKIQITLEKLLADKVKVSEKEVDEFLKSQTSQDPSVTPQVPNREETKELLKQQKLQTEASNLIEKLRKDAKIYSFVSY